MDRLGVQVGHGGPGSVASGAGDASGDALVWPSRVVVDLVFDQDGAQVALNWSFCAAGSYSLMRPPRTARRLIRS